MVAEFPHDPDAYCQGLFFDDGMLYEGTGRYGESTLRRVDLATGRPEQLVRLDRNLFGEGITPWGNHIIQLTWKEHVALVYDRQTLQQTGRFEYEGEGWGLTQDGRHLIMSDGSPVLKFLDPETFQVVRRLTVRSNGQRVRRLNELEYIQGSIFANVWQRDYIARISPHGRSHRVDRPSPPLSGSSPRVSRRCAERDRLRCRTRSAVRDWQELAPRLSDSLDSPAVACE